MYGLLQGLQAGTRDAQAANELAMRERQMAEERAMRQRQLAMQEAQHAATMESMGLQLKQQRGIDTAMEGLRGLATRDAAQQQQLGERGIMSFAPEDWTDTSERAYNQKYMGLAAAKGDAEGMNKLQMRGKLLEANDLAKQWAADPAMREKVYEFMDKSAIPLRIERGEWDPVKRQMKTPDKIIWDDGGKPHALNEADTLRMLQGIAYSKAGLNEESEKAFESVNKRLRDAVNTGNQRKLTGYKFEVDAEDRASKAQDRDEDRKVRLAAIAAHAAQTRLAGVQAARLQRDLKLDEQKQALAAEGAGYAQGLETARTLGPQGRAAADIYGPLLANVRQREIGLGLRAPDPKLQLTPNELAQAATKLVEASGGKLTYQAAVNQITGSYDPMAAMRGALGITGDAASGAGAARVSPGTAKPAAPAAKPISYETMPLQQLLSYTGTSPEARAVYMQRLAEQQRLAQNPRFWVDQGRGGTSGEFGLDRGY